MDDPFGLYSSPELRGAMSEISYSHRSVTDGQHAPHPRRDCRAKIQDWIRQHYGEYGEAEREEADSAAAKALRAENQRRQGQHLARCPRPARVS